MQKFGDGSLSDNIVVYSSWESDKVCQMVLGQVPESFRPLHRFPNVLDALHDVDRSQVDAIMQEAMHERDALDADLALKNISKKDHRSHVRRLGAKLRDRLQVKLRGVEFRSTAWCAQCEKYCYISPRYHEEYRDSVWIEIAGPVCKGYSCMGKQYGWLHPSCAGALVWAYRSAFFEPDRIFKENVERSDEATFNGIFTCKERLQSPFGRTICSTKGASDETTRYADRQSLIFDVYDLGYPCSRRRVYSRWDLMPFFNPRPSNSFQELFFKKTQLNLDVFFVATEQDLLAELEKETKHSRDESRRCSTACASSTGVDWKNLLPGYQQGRVDQYMTACIREDLFDASRRKWSVPCALIDVSQARDHRIHSKTMPTMTQTSRFYEMVRDRPIATLEQWLVHGFPHPSVASLHPDLVGKFPLGDELLKDLSLKQQRLLLGNSMHPAQVCAWFVFSLVEVCVCDADNTDCTDIDDIDSSSSFTSMSLSPIASSDFKTTDFRFRFQISFWLER